MQENFILFHKPFITDDEINEVVDTVKSGWWTFGPKSAEFEKRFANFVGTKRALAVNSWTAGGHIALEAMGVKEGDEVIIPSVTFPATAEIICYLKAKPVIVDVQPGTYNLDPNMIERAITSKTKAIIPVHFAGQPCDMDEIMSIAKKHSLLVLEDAAHAFPAKYKGRMVGSIGDITCFSFYATKTLATGEGGMVCTDNEDFAKRASIMRLHGIDRDAWKRYSSEGDWYYEVVAPGYKYNFTDIAASLGLRQLDKAYKLLEMRKYIYNRYNEAFKDNEFFYSIILKGDRESAYHLYPIYLNLNRLKIDRSGVIKQLKENGVGTGVHFIPLYQHPYYRDTFGLNAKDYPVTETIANNEFSLPFWPGMTDNDIDKVITTLNKVISNNVK